jgi:hypothetical protein
MMVECFNSEFEIPDLLVEKYVKDFDGLAGSGRYDFVQDLRASIHEMLEIVAEEPELLHEKDCLTDFINSLAMKKALEKHGIYYDA